MIPMCKWTYSFIYYLITYVISFYQLNYCFLMPSKICKEHEEFHHENIKYCFKCHIKSLEHCDCWKLSPVYSLYSLKDFYGFTEFFWMIDAAGFVNQPPLVV